MLILDSCFLLAPDEGEALTAGLPMTVWRALFAASPRNRGGKAQRFTAPFRRTYSLEIFGKDALGKFVCLGDCIFGRPAINQDTHHHRANRSIFAAAHFGHGRVVKG